jgi:hypothetical protein
MVTESKPLPDTNSLFNSSDALIVYYKSIFNTDRFYNKDIFFQTKSAEVLRSVFLSLQQAEADFKEKSPGLFSFATTTLLLEKELSSLKRKNLLIETEMNNQKQYADILRTGHSTRELQDYYNNEYEILPKWYKRFGHLLKVVTGKRSFRSLFRNDVKKYKG